MARQEDARIRYRVCHELRRIPAARTSLLPTNPILAALVERSANRRISAGFIVEDATGATDRHHSTTLRLTTYQSYQRMAFCCGGSHKIAPWTRAKRVPRRVHPPPSAATHVRRHSKMRVKGAKRECATASRCPPRKGATSRSGNGTDVKRGAGSPPGGTADAPGPEQALLCRRRWLSKGVPTLDWRWPATQDAVHRERAWHAENDTRHRRQQLEMATGCPCEGR